MTFANRFTTTRILNLNLSKWIVAPFICAYPMQPNFSQAAIRHKFTDVLATVPTQIASWNEEAPLTSLVKFWLTEVDFYNNTTKIVAKSLSGCDADIVADVMSSRVPRRWILVSHCLSIAELDKFILYLCEKRKFLLEKLNAPSGAVVSGQFVNNVKGFFAAFLGQFLVDSGAQSAGLGYVFVPGGEAEKKTDFVIADLWLMNGNIVEGKLAAPDKPRLFTPLPRLLCRVADTSAQRLSNCFVCPLYRCAFVDGWINRDLVAMYDGETENYVVDVLLPSEQGDAFGLLNNTGLYCHVPPNLV